MPKPVSVVASRDPLPPAVAAESSKLTVSTCAVSTACPVLALTGHGWPEVSPGSRTGR